MSSTCSPVKLNGIAYIFTRFSTILLFIIWLLQWLLKSFFRIIGLWPFDFDKTFYSVSCPFEVFLWHCSLMNPRVWWSLMDHRTKFSHVLLVRMIWWCKYHLVVYKFKIIWFLDSKFLIPKLLHSYKHLFKENVKGNLILLIL